MIGKVLIHVAILLTSSLGLAEQQRHEAEDSSSIGHLPMDETSGRVFVTDGSESVTPASDEQEQGDSIVAAETDFAQASAKTEQHERFEPFAGTFKAEMKMWMGSGDPVVCAGVMTNTLILGGRFLQQVYKGDPESGPFPDFEGRGFWGFNKATNKYEGFWIDTTSTQMQTDFGNVDNTGRVWTMVGELTDQTGNTLKKRSVITLEDNDHQKIEMFFPGPDGKEFKTMEIRYERRS